MAVGAGIVAPVGELVARVAECLRRCGLHLLRLGHTGLRFGDRGIGAFRRRARFLGGKGGLAPTGEQQAGFGGLDLVGELGVALGLLGLPLQRGNLRVEPRHQVFEPGEVGLGPAQLALGILAAHVQPCDPRRFLQHGAPLGRLGGDDLRDLALTDERGGVCAGGGIGEGQRHILGPHIAAIDPVGAARPAFDPAGDDQFIAHIIAGMEHHFGKIARGAGGSAREDHVLHSARSHRLGRGFPHDPADRFEQVGFAAAVRADDPR